VRGGEDLAGAHPVVVGRLGGDEFGILLPGMVADAALASVSKLRQRLLDSMEAHRWPVTFSIGVATFDVPPDDIDALLARADALMYAVKQGVKHDPPGAVRSMTSLFRNSPAPGNFPAAC
jgi:diguanylate cyclase (GGDEF)-like protein